MRFILLIPFLTLSLALSAQLEHDINIKADDLISDLHGSLSELANNLLEGGDFISAKRMDELSIALANVRLALDRDIDKKLEDIDANIREYLFQISDVIRNEINLPELVSETDALISTHLTSLCYAAPNWLCPDDKIPLRISRVINQTLSFQKAPEFYLVAIQGNIVSISRNAQIVIPTMNYTANGIVNGNRLNFKIPTSVVNPLFALDSLSSIQIVFEFDVESKGAWYQRDRIHTIKFPSYLTLLPKFPFKYELHQVYNSSYYPKTPCDGCTKLSIPENFEVGFSSLSNDLNTRLRHYSDYPWHEYKRKTFNVAVDSSLKIRNAFFEVDGVRIANSQLPVDECFIVHDQFNSLKPIRHVHYEFHLECSKIQYSADSTQISSTCKWMLDQRLSNTYQSRSCETTLRERVPRRYTVRLAADYSKNIAASTRRRIKIEQREFQGKGIPESFLSYGSHRSEIKKGLNKFELDVMPYYYLNNVKKVFLDQTNNHKRIPHLGEISAISTNSRVIISVSKPKG